MCRLVTGQLQVDNSFRTMRKEAGAIMANYKCSDDSCDMEVMAISCGKCGTELEYKTLAKPDGTKVNILECPKGCGRIKSPTCHGQDMAVI
jgi:hypothetical protein